MQAFSFQTVPSLLLEAGAAARLGKLLRSHHPNALRVVVVTDRFLHTSGLLAPTLADLTESGWRTLVIDDVVADPPESVVLAAADRVRDFGAQIVIGLGGGSSMDVAKLVAVLATGIQPLSDMYGINQVTGGRLPLVQIPTTAGTGSEVTNVSIITTGETTKSGVVAPQLYADMAVLDPMLTLGLPVAVTAATGIDAMVHAIEAYTSALLKNPVSDNLARQALTLLSGHLVAACQDGRNLEARSALLLGATLAGQAFANAPVGAVHALAYPIGGIFHVPHGLSNALVLPHVLRFNLPAAAPLYAELARHLGVAQAGDDDTAQATALITFLEGIADATGTPRRLRDVGIPESALAEMASAAMLQTRLLRNNPRPMDEAQALAVYQAAY